MPNLRGFTGGYDKLLCEKYRPHNPKVVGSNPAPATMKNAESTRVRRFLLLFGIDEKQRFGDYLGIIHIFFIFRADVIIVKKAAMLLLLPTILSYYRLTIIAQYGIIIEERERYRWRKNVK